MPAVSPAGSPITLASPSIVGSDAIAAVSDHFREAAKMIREHGGFTAAQMQTPEAQAVIRETAAVLSQAIDSSIPQDTPAEVRYALENNAFIFSGFKTFHSLREVGLSLTDSKGNIKPFEQFMNDVQTISQAYNRNYLYAEYNHAVSASQMAEKWQHFMEDGDDYDLQYRTAKDDRVREAHRLLDGTTLPPSDPFWEQYLPPNGWNCRCTAVQVRRGKYPLSDSALAIERGNNSTASIAQQIFRYNPGTRLELFPPKHPYYKAPAEVRKAAEKIARIEQNRREYERLKDDPDYKEVHFNAHTGGLKATHKEHEGHENDQTRYFGLSPLQLEKACQGLLYNWGHRAILRREGIALPDGNNASALDLDLDGKIMDIASITMPTACRSALMRKNSQIRRAREQSGDVSESVCLYFHKKEMFDEENLKNSISWYKEYAPACGSEQRIHHVYVVVNGEDEIRMYDI